MEVPQKIKNRMINLAIPFLDIYREQMKTEYQRDSCTPTFTAALLRIIKIWRQPNCLSIGEWIKKVWSIYTMEYYPNISKKESCNVPQCE